MTKEHGKKDYQSHYPFIISSKDHGDFSEMLSRSVSIKALT